MASWSAEEVEEGIERWLKKRRDEFEKDHGSEAAAYYAVDGLLDELRDAAVEGWFPWQRISDGVDDAI